MERPRRRIACRDMAHWPRRNRLLLVAWVLIVAVAIPIALLSRDDKPVADREALVVAQRLNMSLTALPRYGEMLFDNG